MRDSVGTDRRPGFPLGRASSVSLEGRRATAGPLLFHRAIRTLEIAERMPSGNAPYTQFTHCNVCILIPAHLALDSIVPRAGSHFSPVLFRSQDGLSARPTIGRMPRLSAPPLPCPSARSIALHHEASGDPHRDARHF